MRTLRCALVLFLLGTTGSFAEVPLNHEERSLQFADSLMLQQRFRESELEYERLAVMQPSDPQRLLVLRKMFDAAMATQDYAFTLKLSRAWEDKTTGADQCLPAWYEQLTLYALGNYPAVLKQPLLSSCDSQFLNDGRYLHGLANLHLRQWALARADFSQISQDASVRAKAHLAIQTSFDGPQLQQKSPGLAAGLNAILPGAGYAYANRPQTAVACFVVNGLFIWGTVASVHAKEPGLAALLSLFSFSWYFGGIYGGAQAAQKETQSRLTAFVEPLELIH